MIIKNSNVRRKIFQSRYTILGGLIAVILIIIVINSINANVEKEMAENKTTNIVENKIENAYIPEQTMGIGSDVTKEEQTKNEAIVEQFFNYCNQKQIEQAYALVSDDCKEQLYPTLEDFNKRYIQQIFKSKKMYSMQSWIYSGTATYEIKIIDDILSTGVANSSDAIQDYYTIVQKEGKQYLNINSYVKKKEINKEVEKDGIKIVLESEDIYLDYHIYHFSVLNNTENTIILDTGTINKSLYETDNLGTTYMAYTYETNPFFLTVESKRKKTIDLKFSKIYKPTTWIKSITFSDIIRNKEEYEQASNKAEYQREKITLQLYK